MNPQLLASIDALLASRDHVVLAIDGPCASGKSTLAQALADHYQCPLIHLDDFFLQPHQRTPDRLSQPGGNVDYERFQSEVLTPLCARVPFSFRPFDCSCQSLAAPVEVTPARLTIVEGSYSQHPYFGDCYDLRVFLTVSAQTQRRRILVRPAFLHRRFFEEWIPMEQNYFTYFSIREKADLVLSTE